MEGLGFSPFDLLFGRHANNTPLSLLKDQWFDKSDTIDQIKKFHVPEFVMSLGEKIRFFIAVATKLYAQQQAKIKTHYDKKASGVEFVPGQQVLVWLPRDGKPLSLRTMVLSRFWKGRVLRIMSLKPLIRGKLLDFVMSIC